MFGQCSYTNWLLKIVSDKLVTIICLFTEDIKILQESKHANLQRIQWKMLAHAKWKNWPNLTIFELEKSDFITFLRWYNKSLKMDLKPKKS